MFLYRHLTYSFSSSQALCDWFCVISQNDCEEDQARDTQLHSFERVHFPYVNDWSASVYKSDGTVGSARVGVYHSHVKLQHLNLTVWLFSFDHLICVVRWMQDDSRRHVAHIIQWVNRSIVQRPGVIRPFLSMWDSYVYLHHFFPLTLSLFKLNSSGCQLLQTQWTISNESESTKADTPHKRMLHRFFFNEALQQHWSLIPYKLSFNMVENTLTCFRQPLIQIMNLQRQDKS